MTKQHPHPTLADLVDFEFDGTQLVEIPTGREAPTPVEWHMMERGSDKHIAFLELILGQMQATLDELRAQRAKHAD